eukprot:c2507_g1_i2.p1 GENE.c2507_g1_i2~~c2507_g1_i2.p1  ORF type:complete len:351 (+),score=57.22 c2507_g1_i2:119-1171(+)
MGCTASKYQAALREKSYMFSSANSMSMWQGSLYNVKEFELEDGDYPEPSYAPNELKNEAFSPGQVPLVVVSDNDRTLTPLALEDEYEPNYTEGICYDEFDDPELEEELEFERQELVRYSYLCRAHAHIIPEDVLDSTLSFVCMQLVERGALATRAEQQMTPQLLPLSGHVVFDQSLSTAVVVPHSGAVPVSAKLEPQSSKAMPSPSRVPASAPTAPFRSPAPSPSQIPLLSPAHAPSPSRSPLPSPARAPAKSPVPSPTPSPSRSPLPSPARSPARVPLSPSHGAHTPFSPCRSPNSRPHSRPVHPIASAIVWCEKSIVAESQQPQEDDVVLQSVAFLARHLTNETVRTA